MSLKADAYELSRIFSALSDPLPDRRRVASIKLKTIDENEPTRVRTFIRDVISTQPKEIEWTTIEALREVGPTQQDIPALQIALQHARSYSVRWRAIEALCDIDVGIKFCLREVVEALGDDNYWVRWHAHQALKTLDYSTIIQTVLMVTRHDPRGRVRSEGVLFLGQYGKRVTDVSSLTRALESDPDPLVRSAAAASLARIARKETMDALIAALSDSDPNVKRNALDGLRMSSRLSGGVIKRLESFLNDPEVDVRAKAAIALAKNRYLTMPVLKGLVETLEQQPWNTLVFDALLTVLSKSRTLPRNGFLRLSPSTLQAALAEAIAQGVLPTIGVKTWHQLQIEFPSRDYPWTDKGVFHSWRSHNVSNKEKLPHKANLVCINSDWFTQVHLIAVACLIMSPRHYLKLLDMPPNIEGEAVGFILQSGGTLHQLEGMRRLIKWQRTNRIDFVFSDDLRTIQHLMFAGMSAQIPTARRNVQERRGADVWMTFCRGISRLLQENQLAELVHKEWFLEAGWSSSRYRMRFERPYVEIEPHLTALARVIRSSPKLRSEVSSFVTRLVDELESSLWSEGLKKLPSNALRVLSGGELG